MTQPLRVCSFSSSLHSSLRYRVLPQSTSRGGRPLWGARSPLECGRRDHQDRLLRRRRRRRRHRWRGRRRWRRRGRRGRGRPLAPERELGLHLRRAQLRGDGVLDRPFRLLRARLCQGEQPALLAGDERFDMKRNFAAVCGCV